MERVHLSLTFSLVLSPFFFFFFFSFSFGHFSDFLGSYSFRKYNSRDHGGGEFILFFFFLYYPLHVLLALPLELMYTLGGILDWL